MLVSASKGRSGPETRKRELSALFAAGGKLGCSDLVLVTDRENGEETRGDLRVRIVDAPTWLLESDTETLS